MLSSKNDAKEVAPWRVCPEARVEEATPPPPPSFPLAEIKIQYCKLGKYLLYYGKSHIFYSSFFINISFLHTFCRSF
jgi:hypothetical protein